MHVVEVPGAPRPAGQGLGRGRRGREAQLDRARRRRRDGDDRLPAGVAAGDDQDRGPADGGQRQLPERGPGDSAAGGSQTCVSSSPGRSPLWLSPVTKPAAGTSRRLPPGPRSSSTPSRALAKEVIGPAGSDRQMLPPTVATLCTLNEPRSAWQHCRASAAAGARGGGPAASGRAQRACTSRRSARRRLPPTGVQPKARRSSSRVTLGAAGRTGKSRRRARRHPPATWASVAGASSVTPFRSTGSVRAVRASPRVIHLCFPSEATQARLLASFGLSWFVKGRKILSGR